VGLAAAGIIFCLVRHGRGRQQAAWAFSDPSTIPGRVNISSARALGVPKKTLLAERRSSLRRPGNPVAVLVASAQASTQPWEGWVIDRSRGGLRLAVPKPMAVGTLLKVRTTHDPECAPWVQLRVQRCRPRDGVWVLGCQFVQLPPINVLLLF